MAGVQASKIRLPLTLLTEPLPPSQAARLHEKDKKSYNLQKAKYEVAQKMMAKRPI